MTPLLFALVAAAGGFGAVARFVLDAAITRRAGAGWGTFLINVTGSFALGLVAGWTTRHLLSPDIAAVLGIGFLGGYTTFSTAMWEAVQRSRTAPPPSALSALGMLTSSVLAAWLGLLISG